MFQGLITSKIAGKVYNDKELLKIVKRHAFFGALIMMIPDGGLGTIAYVIVLWHMYSKISRKIGMSFSENFWELAGVGFFVNIAVALVIDMLLTVLFFIEPFIMYLQFYISGKLFIESAKKVNRW